MMINLHNLTNTHVQGQAGAVLNRIPLDLRLALSLLRKTRSSSVIFVLSSIKESSQDGEFHVVMVINGDNEDARKQWSDWLNGEK